MKRLLLIAAGLFALLAAVAAVAAWNLDAFVNANRDTIAAQVETGLGREVEFGEIGVSFRGGLGVRVADLRIGDDPETKERIVLNAGEAYLAPRSVWHGDSVFIGDDEYGECWILDVFVPPRDDLRGEG